MAIAAYIVPIVIVYIILKAFWVEYVTLKAKYKFYSLRDKLRMMAITKEVDEDDKMFDYLDISISKTINELPNLNVWVVIYYYFIHRKDTNFLKFQSDIGIHLRANPKFKEVYDSYTENAVLFSLSKSVVSVLFVSAVILFVRKTISILGRFNKSVYSTVKFFKPIEEYPKYTPFFPETSAAGVYFG